MSGSKALRIALDLKNVPSLVRHVRNKPLPDDVLLLLQIAAGDPSAEQKALILVDRSLTEIRDAAEFFIEQILFAPEADSYRVLGATPNASMADLRRNLALLIRWLHPDADKHGERCVFIGRVTAAWEDLKTHERRAAYNARVAERVSLRPATGRARSRQSQKNFSRFASPRKVRQPPAPGYRPVGLLAQLLSLFSRRR